MTIEVQEITEVVDERTGELLILLCLPNGAYMWAGDQGARSPEFNDLPGDTEYVNGEPPDCLNRAFEWLE